MKYRPYKYQQHATDHIIQAPGAGLFMEMGLGKTVSTLTAIKQLMYEEMEVSRVLVIAPKLVAESVWTTESQKWDHLKHIKISVVLGTEKQRKGALKAKADIYVINRENVAWLVAYYGGAFPFDMLVIDELSSFKSAKSARFKALKTVRPKINRVVGLTGTPMPNGLLDMWSQLYLLDMGERLCKTQTEFKAKYFVHQPYKHNSWTIREDKDDLIGSGYYEKMFYERIEDICISMKSEDYLELPKRLDQTVEVRLPDDIMSQYREFEKSQVLALMSGDMINAVNAGALTNKLLQFANGAVYKEDKEFIEIHSAKLEALAEDVEAANGHPFLVFYSYRSDLERIMKHLKAYKPKILQGSADITDWNAKKLPLLLAHPASAGHGLNMQAGGNLMGWYGLPWSLELYLQAVARLDRQGQTQAVINRRYAVRGTMDMDVIKALDNKRAGQDALMEAVKARVKQYL